MKQLVLCAFLLLSMQTYSINSNNIDNILDKFIGNKQVKSPEVYSFEKYGAYPVNMSVGIPDISIPIYTIETGKLKFPISLSYHLSGIKVDEISSWVGLGWTLNAGGMISRNTLGLPDEVSFLKMDFTYQLKNYNGTVINGVGPIQESEFDMYPGTTYNFYNMKWYLEYLENGTDDGQSDIYNYSTNDISGTFMYNLNRELIQVPLSDNKIIRSANNTFEIISDNGTRYVYKDFEYRTLRKSVGEHISAWLITDIISSDLVDTIRFNYTDPTTYYEEVCSTTLSDGCKVFSNGVVYNDYYDDTDNQKNYSTYYTKERLLSSIEFRGGTIKFNISARKDKRQYKLEDIVIKNRNGTLISRVSFEYDYFGGRTSTSKFDKRLKLNRVLFWGNSNVNPKFYSFTYNSQDLPNYYEPSLDYYSLMNSGYYAQDFWGYYNGDVGVGNKNLVGKVPSQSILYDFNMVANRNPSETYMKSCSLERIDYPTGGFTVFETEANRVNNEIYGGLRIKKIIAKLNDNDIASTQTYTYEDPQVLFNPDISKYVAPMPQKLITSTHTGWAANDYGYRNYYMEEPVAGVRSYMGSSVVYKKVIKDDSNISGKNGKVIYTFQDAATFRFMSLLLYGVDPGKEYYDKPNDWMMGKVLTEEYFEYGVTNPVKRIEYQYVSYQQKYNDNNEIPIGKSARKRINMLHSNIYLCPDCWTLGTNLLGAEEFEDGKSFYECTWTYTNTGIQKLKKLIESTLDKETNQYITNTTDYVYGNANLTANKNYILTEKITYNSNNNLSKETYSYPFNYTIEPYKEMTLKNILSQTVSTTEQTGNDYKVQKNNFIKIDSAYLIDNIEFGINGNLEKRIQYHNYTGYGTPLYIARDNVDKVVYLWSYKGQYLIAEIKNATLSDVETAVRNVFSLTSIDDLSTLSTPNENKLQNGSLQNALPNALVTTYTYKPLVGMTSMTDPRGVTTYYNYDDFNRLQSVKDKYNNPFSEYWYHYYGNQ